MKKCPFCAEDIQLEAKKCKHCGEWLAESRVPDLELPSDQTSSRSDPEQSDGTLPPMTEQASDAAPHERSIPPVLAPVPASNAWDKKKLLISWAVATYLLVSLQSKNLLNPEVPGINKWTLIVLSLLEVAFALMLISKFRGTNRSWRDPSPGATQLSTWGLAWRAVVSCFTGGVIVLLFEKIFGLDHLLISYTPIEMTLWEVPRAVGVTIACWLLFSRDHRSQFRFLMTAGRGY